ncbi:MAG: 2-oxoacid:acceptor oxidoreductase family protein [Fibrobacteres bacterium]|nr:2-oxoacid:acceptor oxidoreductase family protein [Fibrobacterota bacterium]
MEYRCIFAGFGGQGVISMGMMLAYAGMVDGKQSTFFPAYGIAMRGGTANCTVVVSDSEIASPVVYAPTVMVVMNDLSFDHFQPMIAKNGTMFVNSSLVERKTNRSDIKIVEVAANDIAVAGGDSRMANMAMLGAVVKATGMVSMASVGEAMKKTFPSKILHLVSKNIAVLENGAAAVK